MVKALEDIFLSVPTDCLEIIADYISAYDNRFNTARVEELLYETARLGDVKCFKEAASFTMRDDPFYVEDERLTSYVNSDGKSLLCVAAENGNLALVRYLVLRKNAENTSPLVIEKHRNALLYPIFAAARWGHLDVVKFLYQKHDGHSSYMYRTDGSRFEFGNILHWACHYGHTRVARYLLSQGMDPNITTCYGSIITDICHNDNPRLLSEIIKLPFLDRELINYQTATGITPLTLAACHDYTDMILCLLAHGATPNTNGPSHELSAYTHCCRHGNIKCMKAMEENGFVPEANQTYLDEAAKQGQPDVIRYLVKKGYDINQITHGMSPLYSAIKYGQRKAVKALLSLGADINLKSSHAGKNALMESITCIVSNYKDFIKRGISLSERDHRGRTAAMILITGYKRFTRERTHEHMVTVMLPRLKVLLDAEKAAGLKLFAETLWYALRIKSNPEIIEAILPYIENIDEQSPSCDTALHLAIQFGYTTRIVDKILEMGADIHAENANGQNAFVKALIARNDIYIERFLPLIDVEDTFYLDGSIVETCPWMYVIEYAPSYSLRMIKRVKGSIYERFKRGPTALMIAAKSGNEAIIDCYTDIPRGYLDFAGSDGNTALMLAAEAGHESIVKTLIQKGADHSLRNKAGKTALSLARVDSITEFLLYNV